LTLNPYIIGWEGVLIKDSFWPLPSDLLLLSKCYIIYNGFYSSERKSQITAQRFNYIVESMINFLDQLFRKGFSGYAALFLLERFTIVCPVSSMRSLAACLALETRVKRTRTSSSSTSLSNIIFLPVAFSIAITKLTSY